jgi:hypothetical protein
MAKAESPALSLCRGNAVASPLFQRVVSSDRAVRMPLGVTPLRGEQVAMLRKWIDDGAVWPAVGRPQRWARKHWSYIKPVRPPVPPVTARCEIRSITSSSPAAKGKAEFLAGGLEGNAHSTVSLDLIGLPPTIEEIDSFLADDRPDAYERWWSGCWRRRITESDGRGPGSISPVTPIATDMRRIAADDVEVPRLGDRCAQSGHAVRPVHDRADRRRHATGRDHEQKIATGFHRNTMFNEEGGVDKERLISRCWSIV